MPLTKKNRTGFLSYYKNIPSGPQAEFSSGPQSLSIDLWITHLQQTNQLTGVYGQSVRTRHFYPRSYGPGDLVVTGISPNQQDLKTLGAFIREHQEYMLTGIAPVLSPSVPTPTTQVQTVTNYTGLLILQVPNEGIHYYGWIPRFTNTFRGVFEPAPIWTFNFTVAVDNNTPQPLANTSFEITKTINDIFSGQPELQVKLPTPWVPPNNLP